QVSQGALLLLEIQHLLEIYLIARGRGVGPIQHHATILSRHPGKPSERIESHDFSKAVEGLVDSSHGGEERKILAPSATEFEHTTLDWEDLSVQEIHEQNARQGLRRQEEPHVHQQFLAGNRAGPHHLEKSLSTRRFG